MIYFSSMTKTQNIMKERVIKQVTVNNTVYDVVICEAMPASPACYYCALGVKRCVSMYRDYEDCPCITKLSERANGRSYLVAKKAGQ